MTTENNQSTQATSTTAAEPSMAEYARMREAEMRGQKPEPATPAAAVATTTEAAATEEEIQAAAAATEGEAEGKKPTESATEEDPEKQIEDTHPAKKGINKRFSEMTAKQKELQAQADQAKAEAEAARKEAQDAKAEAERLRSEAEKALNAIPKVVPADEDPMPNRNDFDDPDEYVSAMSAHTARQEIRKSQEAAKVAAEENAAAAKKAADEARQVEITKAIEELHSNFQKRQAEVKPEYHDYDEKVLNNDKLVLRNDVFFAIERAPDSPHILYHIASNPEIAESLNKMNQIDAATRIGELQAELRYARKAKPSKAAEPIKPVGSRQSPQQKTPHEETMEEYAARREKELKESANKRTKII